MQEVAFYTRGRECRVVRFEENYTNYVVTDVTFPLKLLWVVFLVR